MSPVERAALALTALPVLSLGLAHFSLRRLKLNRRDNLIGAAFLMLQQVWRVASRFGTLVFVFWFYGTRYDPEAYEAAMDAPSTVFVLMGSAMLAYLYLIIRWCWQMWLLRRAPRELAK